MTSVNNTKTVSVEYFKLDLKVKMRLLLFIKYKLEKNISHQGDSTLNEKDILENFSSLRFGHDQHVNMLANFSVDNYLLKVLNSDNRENPNRSAATKKALTKADDADEADDDDEADDAQATVQATAQS